MTQNIIAAIILAAGNSSRMSSSRKITKPYIKINNESLLSRCIKTFLANRKIKSITVVIRNEDIAHYKKIIAQFPESNIYQVFGGQERHDSVRNALLSLQETNPTHVLIHDCARPFLSQALLSRVIDGLQKYQNIIPILPISDTIKTLKGDRVASTFSRDGLYVSQTPQAFSYRDLIMCHKICNGRIFTDDSGLMESYSMPVHTVSGDPQNIKITYEWDLNSNHHLDILENMDQ